MNRYLGDIIDIMKKFLMVSMPIFLLVADVNRITGKPEDSYTSIKTKEVLN